MNKYYTGIGSRKTPESIRIHMIKIGYALAKIGYTGRSGKADGADTYFQLGFQHYRQTFAGEFDNRQSFEAYIPWRGFKSKHDQISDEYDIYINNNKIAMEIAATLHPAWDKCKRGAKLLHTRNVYQVLGGDLKTPSDFVIYWCEEDKRGNPKGGTATAVNLAKRYNIPTINMLHSDWSDKLVEVVPEFKI